MRKERVKVSWLGINPILSSCEQLGLSAFPSGNSCCFIRMNGKQNFDFLIGEVINLPSRLGENQLGLCAQAEALIMDPTRCSTQECPFVFQGRRGRGSRNYFLLTELNNNSGNSCVEQSLNSHGMSTWKYLLMHISVFFMASYNFMAFSEFHT